MKNIIVSLEGIASAAEKDSDVSKAEQAIKSARGLIKNFPADPLLKELDRELSVWQSKLAVILKEPAGKKGMAQHARFWVEKLRKFNDK